MGSLILPKETIADPITEPVVRDAVTTAAQKLLISTQVGRGRRLGQFWQSQKGLLMGYIVFSKDNPIFVTSFNNKNNNNNNLFLKSASYKQSRCSVHNTII